MSSPSSAACTGGESGPAPIGWPTGRRLNVSLVPGTSSRKKLKDMASVCRYAAPRPRIAMRGAKVPTSITTNATMPSAWPALKCPVLDKPNEVKMEATMPPRYNLADVARWIDAAVAYEGSQPCRHWDEAEYGVNSAECRNWMCHDNSS